VLAVLEAPALGTARRHLPRWREGVRDAERLLHAVPERVRDRRRLAGARRRSRDDLRAQRGAGGAARGRDRVAPGDGEDLGPVDGARRGAGAERRGAGERERRGGLEDLGDEAPLAAAAACAAK